MVVPSLYPCSCHWQNNFEAAFYYLFTETLACKLHLQISLADHLHEFFFFFTSEIIVSSNQRTPVKANRAILSPFKVILFTMAEIFPLLETSVNEFIAEQGNKDTRAKTERDLLHQSLPQLPFRGMNS